MGRDEVPLISFSGHYSSFREAKQNTGSYDSAGIVEKAEKTAREFKSDKKSLDADLGIILTEYGALFSVLTKLAYKNNGSLNLVDFGGSAGYFYFQVKNFLGDDVKIKWTVVELGPIVEIGNKYYANQELSFASDFDKAVKEKQPSILLVSGTIQYLENPKEFIDKAIGYGFEHIIIDRTPFTNAPSHVQVQHVRKPIYDASFPLHILNYNEFIKMFSGKYKVWFHFPAYDKKIGEADAKGIVFIKNQPE